MIDIKSIEKVLKEKILILDGPMGTMIQEKKLDEAAQILLNKGPDYVIIKRGEKGATVYDGESKKEIPSYKKVTLLTQLEPETLLLALQWDILLKKENVAMKLSLEQCIMDLLQPQLLLKDSEQNL